MASDSLPRRKIRYRLPRELKVDDAETTRKILKANQLLVKQAGQTIISITSR